MEGIRKIITTTTTKTMLNSMQNEIKDQQRAEKMHIRQASEM